MGYHPGIEDDSVYLSAIKGDLNPALYPHDSEFFRVQLQATLFDKWVAGFIHWTHIPVGITEFLWQICSIALIIFGCWCIARTLFPEDEAQWGGVAMITAMLTLPVAGTALYLADQHLHPRNLSAGIILVAVSRIMNGKKWHAVPLLLLGFVIHPIMATLGMSFCIFLTMAMHEPVHVWLRSLRDSLAAAVPLGWIFEPPTPIWRKALATRTYFFLYQWAWYEWLGAIAPLFLFWILWRIALKRGETQLARFALAVFAYAIFQQAAAMIILGSPSLVRLTPFQPMRYLQLVYFFMVLIAGCLIGKLVVKSSTWRWALYLLVINTGMYSAQRALFSASDHIEFPGTRISNPRIGRRAYGPHEHTTDAYFAMNLTSPLMHPVEDYHSFRRALAERSQTGRCHQRHQLWSPRSPNPVLAWAKAG